MKTSRCMLCWSFTQNQADYLITFGSADKELVVCRYCLEDLTLLGFNVNQIIRLRKVRASKLKRDRRKISLVKSLLKSLVYVEVFYHKLGRLPSVRKFLFRLFRTLRSGECLKCSFFVAKRLKQHERGVWVAYLRVYG